MFRLNFLSFLSDFPLRREKTDLVMRMWKADNKAIYAAFLKRIDAVADGDLSVLFGMYSLMKDCIPPDAQTFYGWFSDLLTGKISNKKALQDNQHWAGPHTEQIARCITNRQLWLGIDLAKGTVDIYTSRQKGLLMLRSGTPTEIWHRLPSSMKSYLIEQTDRLLKNSKGICLFSGLERKELYQALAFFANLFMLSQAVFIPDFLANLYDKVVEKKEPLAYCMYHFVVFDHGLTRMTDLLNDILQKDDVDMGGMVLIRNCIHLLVHDSMALGVETKTSWERATEDCNPEIWKDVMFALRKAKGKRGKKNALLSLDDILIGNKAALKEAIVRFCSEHAEDICLAYLLRVLVRAEKVKPSTSYMTFHRAMEQFLGKHIGHDVPQKRYGELKELSLAVRPRDYSFRKAKDIIDRWTPVFARIV